MKITYDPYADAIYMRFNSLATVNTETISKDVIMDYAKDNMPVGMEILDISKKVPRKQLGKFQVELNTEKPQELLP